MITGIVLLILNVYHEARGEPDLGQQAVAHVVYNRMARNDRTMTEVILRPKQFSWTLEPKTSWVPRNFASLETVMRNVLEASYGDDPTHGATHYHTLSVSPYWASSQRLEHTVTIGNHRFYRRTQ